MFMKGYYCIQNFLFLIKSDKRFLGKGWFLFISKIYEKDTFKIVCLVPH